MNNPISVNCPQNTWTRIATGVQNICILASDKSPASYLMTYRMTGDAAPTAIDEGVPCLIDAEPLEISASAGVDVYIYAAVYDGKVRVDA